MCVLQKATATLELGGEVAMRMENGVGGLAWNIRGMEKNTNHSVIASHMPERCCNSEKIEFQKRSHDNSFLFGMVCILQKT